MRLTIVISDEMKQRLDRYIAQRFGNKNVRAVSLVIREAINNFLRKEEKLESTSKK